MKVPRGLVKEDAELPLKPSPWTQEETEALHEMSKEYLWKKRFGKKATVWGLWFLGFPMAIWTFVEPLEKLFKFIKMKLFG